MTAHDTHAHGHRESAAQSHQWRTAADSAAYLVPLLDAGARVLDIGSGPGTITIDLARLVAPGSVIGVDVSTEAVEEALGLAVDNGIGNVSFTVGDAHALDFASDTFDVVHAHQMLHHVADPVAVLREARRVLKPGGIFAARDMDFGGAIWAPAAPALTQWLSVFQDSLRAHGGEPHAGRSLKHWALEAGFHDVVATASVSCFSSDADREWWAGFRAEEVVASNFASRAIETGHVQLADLHAMERAWHEWGAAEDGWFVMPHGEIIARA